MSSNQIGWIWTEVNSSFWFRPGFWLHQPGAVDGEPVVRLQGDGHHRPLHAAPASPGETTRRRRLRPAGGIRAGPLRQQPGRLPARLQPAGIQPGDGSASYCPGVETLRTRTLLTRWFSSASSRRLSTVKATPSRGGPPPSPIRCEPTGNRWVWLEGGRRWRGAS